MKIIYIWKFIRKSNKTNGAILMHDRATYVEEHWQMLIGWYMEFELKNDFEPIFKFISNQHEH